MIDVIGEFLPQAFAGAMSPVPIMAMALILATPRARSNGFAFLAGWLIGTLVVTSIVISAGNGRDYGEDSGPSTVTALVLLGVGLLMLVFAFTQWQSRPRGDEEAKTPGWMNALDGIGPAAAFGLALLNAVANTKNLPVAVGVGAIILRAGLDFGQNFTLVVIYSLIVAIGVAIPLVIYLVMGPRAEDILDGMRSWLSRNNNVIMTVLFLILGANLAGSGIQGLF